MGWHSIQIVGASAFVIFTLLQKIQKMVNKDDIWVSPYGRPHMPMETGGGENEEYTK